MESSIQSKSIVRLTFTSRYRRCALKNIALPNRFWPKTPVRFEGKKIARLWSRGTLRVLEEVVIKAIVSGPIVIFSLLEVAVKINAVIDPCLSCLLFPIHFLVFLNVTRVWLVYFDPWSFIDTLAVLNIVHIIWYFFLSFFEFWRDDNEKTFSFWSMETWNPSVMAAIFRGLPRNCQ